MKHARGSRGMGLMPSFLMYDLVFRLVEIASNRFPDYFNPLTPEGKSNILKMTQNIHIMNAKSTQEVLQRWITFNGGGFLPNDFFR